MQTAPSIRRRIWRPSRTSDLAAGLALAIVLPWFAAWLSNDLAVFQRFPGLPYLIATVAVALVGRLSASLVATISSGLLIAFSGTLPGGTGATDARDLAAIAVFVGLSFVIAYALALKDAATEQAGAAGAKIEEAAAALAAERNTMRQVLEEMPDGVIVVDASGRQTTHNARSRQLLGVDEFAMAEQGADDRRTRFIARRPDGRRYADDEYPIVRSLRSGEVVIGERIDIERSDGTTVMIEVDSAPLRAVEDGTITGAVTVFQDVTERMETQSRLAQATTRLRQIQAVTDVALSGLGFDELAERLLQTVRGVLGADCATLLLMDRGSQSLIEHTTVGVVEHDPGGSIPVGEGIAGKIAGTVSPLVVEEISSYEVVRPWLRETMSSLMGVPLVYRGEVRGVIHVATQATRRFTDDDVEVLTLAANRIASALERAALYESRSAMSEALQRSLAPVTLPTIDGVDLAALYRPFSPEDEIGGDFYDVFPHGEGTWGIAVGDVSGKGPTAAAVMGLAAHTLRAIAMYETRPSAVLSGLNASLLRAERVPSERFCTACAMRLRSEPDHLRVTVCLAGHPQPFVVRTDGTVEHVGEPGTLLGSFADPDLHDVAVDLHPGDALVAYTDGLVEQRGIGLEQGDRDLAAALSAFAGRESGEILAGIERALLGPMRVDDDVAIVVVKKR